MSLRKVINSSTQQFEPVLVDKLVLDAVPTVNSFNSVTSDAVARAVAGASGEVPAVTESDNGKVLKAIYDEGGAAVEWGSEPTVDQTYDASSENAQSGVAVAEAIAAIPSSSYAAGDGIDIENGEISVDIANTLDFIPKTVTTTYTGTTRDYASSIILPMDLRSAVLSSTAELTIQFPSGTFYYFDAPTKPLRIGVLDAYGNKLVSSEVSLTYHEEMGEYRIDAQTVTVSCPASDWEYSSGSAVSSISELQVVQADSNGVGSAFYTKDVGDITYTLTQTDPNKTLLTVKNPLPASTASDSSKVLTVNASGNPEWQTAQGGGGGASVEAGAGLVKSGDTLSVNAYRGLRIGEPMSSFSIDSSNKFFTTPYFRNMASQVKCLCSTEASTSASWYGTTTAHIVIANADNAVYGVSTVEFEAGRYYESSTYLPRALYVPITFDASNFTMNAGHTFSDLGDNYATVNVFVTLKGTTGSSETPNGEQPLYVNKAYLSTLTSLNEIFYPTTEPPAGQRSFLTADYFNGMYSPFWNVAYPKPTSADAGKVLQVQNDGTLAWVTLS